MPKASSRPSLPTSSTDFALPPSSSNATSPASPLDDIPPLLHRFRRPSLLAPKAGYFSESRLHSPLAGSFTLASRRRDSQSRMSVEESDHDKDRMWTDSPSSSSENATPPLSFGEVDDEDRSNKPKKPRHPSTPPRKLSSSTMDTQEIITRPAHIRRLSFPLKPPRILHILAESHPEENEVKSEAAFQRLLSSCSELPMQPRTPRSASDRGRYPEEAVHDEPQREETPSDDENNTDESTFAFNPPHTGSEPINIIKPCTPASSVNGDDPAMYISESPGSMAMDIDLQPLGSPSFSSSSNQWRYTPPPTSSAVRSNKRKFDDRFDPYPTASKRRAVSPSLSHLRDAHSTINSPISSRATPRLPISIPISIPGSTVNSAASSPTISTSFTRPIAITSSPTLRATIGLASPILRPVTRRRLEGEEKEIEGAGEAVGGLTLG